MKINPIPRFMVLIAFLSTFILSMLEPTIAITEGLSSIERQNLAIQQGFGFCFDSDMLFSPTRGDLRRVVGFPH